jgi:hypothetical protein
MVSATLKNCCVLQLLLDATVLLNKVCLVGCVGFYSCFFIKTVVCNNPLWICCFLQLLLVTTVLRDKIASLAAWDSTAVFFSKLSFVIIACGFVAAYNCC